MTCPGCHANDKGAGGVGHDADCEVMSEKAVLLCHRCRNTIRKETQSWVENENGVFCDIACAHVDRETRRMERRRRVQASPGAPQIPPEPQDTGERYEGHYNVLAQARKRIRERLREKRSLYDHYHQHTKRMWEEHDAHGGWDSFINGSEVSNRIDELEWCLAVIEGREP